jgi:hypothetical protein
MKIKIDKPGIYELKFLEELPVTPPVVNPEPPTIEPPVVNPPPIVTPPVQPPVTTPTGIKGELIELFTNPWKWSKPVEVWEYNEPSGGVFIPISSSEFLQQDRSGGKIRWYMGSEKKNGSIVNTKGQSVDVHIQDAKYYGTKVYGVFASEKEIWLGVCDNPTANKPRFVLVQNVQFEGAKDTKHALLIKDPNNITIYGRLRNIDWTETDPVLGDRRGVRRIQVRKSNITLDVYLDPAIEQPRYATNQYRYDYYSTRVCDILGFEVLQISCFQKKRQACAYNETRESNRHRSYCSYCRYRQRNIRPCFNNCTLKEL